ncbi:MAG TPA: DUF4407 domain-containing protein [Streptosporangiaceae bacterium]|nr:DUF4407 domain-containing protein [Streptosporangiaceae bacterium]
MTDPHGLDQMLTFVYDDGPASSTPIVPRPESGPRRRWPQPRWPLLRRRWRIGDTWRALRRTHPFGRLGDFLLFLTAADSEKVGSRSERYRYGGVGLLMLVTSAQAFYAATLFASVSLGKSFRAEAGYGIFFAAAVYFIDRSIISFASPIRKDEKGTLAAPKKASWVLGLRVVIAVAAALLMSEMVLLQVFAGDITEQIQIDHIAAEKVAGSGIAANYQARIGTLQGQIDAAQGVVSKRQDDVSNAYHAMNCQEFGCPGITAGLGPGFAAAKVNWQNAVGRLSAAQNQLQSVRTTDQPQINQLTTAEQQAINGAAPAITNADKILSQEQAFWQLTVKNGTVLVVRLLLSLLILGIDLAPILTKLTGRTSVHDLRTYSDDFLEMEKNRHEVGTAVYQYARRSGVDRDVYDIELETVLHRARRDADVARAEASAKADVDIYGIKLDASLGKYRHHHSYQAAKAALLPDAAHARPSPPPEPDDVIDPHQGHILGLVPAAAPTPADVVAPAGARAADRGDGLAPEADPDAPGPPPDPDDLPDSAEVNGLAGLITGFRETPDLFVLDRRWELHGPLPGADSGGGGTVWRAKDRLGDPRDWYVVKTVPSGQMDRQAAEYIQQLEMIKEKRTVGLIDAHIGQIVGYGDDRGFSYLVYPLYKPGSLAVYWRWNQHRIRLPWCAQVIDEVLSGLIAASVLGLVHLDIKPGNIVLDGAKARVIDWGLSRVWNASRPSTWVAAGTPFFACPEQLFMPGAGWDTPRADLYGVGATVYWLLTGEAPLEYEAGDGKDFVGFRNLIMGGARPQWVHELVRGVPRPLGLLIDSWLSADPAQRVPPGTAMVDSLRVAREQLRALTPMPDVPVGQITGRRRGRPR